MNRPPVKPKLLVLELWGLGDLAIATPFLRAAAEKYSVTLLAKPQACELLPRLWPTIEVIPFNAPWTAFRGKYHLWRWDWREMLQLRRRLRAEKFDCVVSGRWDPRDHLLMKATRAAARLGFPRLNSGCLLTQSLSQPHQLAHRAEFWRVAGAALGLAVPRREEIIPPPRPASAVVFIHTGAAQPVRVWPLENYRQIAARLREKNFTVQIACDPDQLDWWQQQGENAVCPRRLSELFTHLDGAGIFIGNDPAPAISPQSAALPRSPCSAPNCPNDLSRCIRRRKFSRAAPVRTSPARTIATMKNRFASATLRWTKSGRAFQSLRKSSCGIDSSFKPGAS